MSAVVRVSILRCEPADFGRLRQMMIDAEARLRPGIEAMPGLLAFYAGAAEASHSLTNTSVWDSLAHARQLDRFQPMLDAARQFAVAGASFERPIMNYASLWHFGPRAPAGARPDARSGKGRQPGATLAACRDAAG